MTKQIVENQMVYYLENEESYLKTCIHLLLDIQVRV